MTTSAAPRRVLVIGFDGFTFDVIDPLLQRGRLPNIARLVRSGARGRLVCPPPTNSIVGWTSFMTGTNVGKHGIYNFETMVPGDGSFVATDSRMRANAPFWQILSDAGKRVVVLNVVGSFPPDRVNGIMVSGKPVPRTAQVYTHPESLTQDLAGAGYTAAFPRPFRTDAEYMEPVDQVASLAKDLLAKNDWDCFVVVFIESDGFQHDHPADMGKIEAFYEEMDRVVGDLLGRVGTDTAVIVTSDHGQANYPRTFHLERFLYQRGYLRLKDDRELLRPIPWSLWRAAGNTSRSRFALFNTTRALQGWAAAAGRALPMPERLRIWMEGKERELAMDPVDWRRTVAYRSKRDGSTANSGGIRLHARNIGIRSDFDTERKELVSRLKEELLGLRDPETGEPIVDSVSTKEELYWGPMLGRLPDLIVKTTSRYHCPRYDASLKSLHDARLVETPRKPKRSHAEEGVLILSGPGLRSGAALRPAIVDVAPTILYLLDQPVPSYMDGSVLIDAVDTSLLDARPVRYVEVEGHLFTAGEFDFSACRPLAADVRDELIRLGYE